MSQSSTSLFQNQFGDIITQKRTQYVQKNETKQIINGIVELTEVPDAIAKVAVTGNNMQWYETAGAPNGNLYQPDYSGNLVYFDPTYNNVSLNFSYMGTGVKLISSNQIYTALDTNGNVTQTLNDLATNAQTQANFAQSAGNSLGYQGIYSTSTAYTKNNIVSFDGVAYICIANTTGNNPTNTSYWHKITSFRGMGVYSSTTVYSYGDFVTDSTNENLYMCVNEGSTGASLTDTTNWDLLISVASAVSNANTATTNANNAANTANTTNTNVTNAENARVTAEDNRVSAESGRASAEDSRVSAETSRANAESTRVSNENTRISQENSRVSAETSRVTAESNRASAETTRSNNESTRQTNETDRINAESGRVSAENTRVSQEDSRASAESTRSSNESTRQSQESTRQSNEATRQSNETSRQNAINNLAAQTSNWSGATAYKARNIVRYNTATYIALQDNTGFEPDLNLGTYWQVVAQDGANGAGTVAGISPANSDVTVTGTAQNPIIGINSGTGANQILKLDANGNLSADLIVDGTNNATFTQTDKTTLSNAIPSSQKGAANGVATLDANSLITTNQIPSLSYIPTSQEGVANGVATLDGTGKVPTSQLPAMNYIPTSQEGVANGVATLDANGNLVQSTFSGTAKTNSVYVGGQTGALGNGTGNSSLISGFSEDSGKFGWFLTEDASKVILGLTNKGASTFGNLASNTNKIGLILNANGGVYSSGGTYTQGMLSPYTANALDDGSHNASIIGNLSVGQNLTVSGVSNITGNSTALLFASTGVTGATAASRYVGGTTSGAPTTGTFAVGDYVIDQSGAIWICTIAGTSGTWIKTGGVTPKIVELPLWRYDGASVTSTATSAGAASSFMSFTTNSLLSTGDSRTKLITLDSWASTTLFAFEIYLYSTSGVGTMYAALWDFTAGAIVSGTQLSTTASVTGTSLMRSGQVSLASGRSYGVTVWTSSSSYSAGATHASLIVFPQ